MTARAHASDYLLLTCEHAGNRIPRAYAPLFRGADALLATHRGWDPGAYVLARFLAKRLRVPAPTRAEIAALIANLDSDQFPVRQKAVQALENLGEAAEESLHAALKKWYAQPGDAIEVPLEGFHIDLVRGDLLVEIQTRNFFAIKRKLAARTGLPLIHLDSEFWKPGCRRA